MDAPRTAPAISALAGSLVGRTPLLPLDTVGQIWGPDGVQAIAALVADPVVAAALTYASPSLAASLRSSSPQTARAQRALLTYVTRMSTRTTPFGLFAGVGTVAVGEATTLTVAEARRRTSSQWDFGRLDPFVAAVEEQLFAAGELRFVFNGATIVKGDRLALIADERELADPDAPRRQSLALTKTLEHLRAWLMVPHRLDAIVAELTTRFGHDGARAREYLRTIWKAGFLISEAARSPNAGVAETRLQLARAHPSAGGWIGDVRNRLNILDGQPLGDAHLLAYRAIDDEARTHEPALVGDARASDDDAKARSPIMVDLSSPFDGELGSNVLADVATMADLALRGGGRMRISALTQRFGRCFEGSTRFVPLLEAVDACLDLLAGGNVDVSFEPNASSPQRELLLDELIYRAAVQKSDEIELGSAAVDVLFPPLAKDAVVPRSMEVGFSIAATSKEAIDAGEFAIVAATMEGSARAGATSARFFRILPPQTEHEIAGDDGTVTAELVYAPRRARLLNVGARSVPAAFEIGVGAFPHVGTNAIELDDLWVSLDERTQRFTVRSKTLGRRVRIIETTALNPRVAAPPAALFLSLISRAEMVVPARFAWSSRAVAHAYRPRLRYGRIVLRPATWQFDKDQLTRDGLASLSARAVTPCPRFVCLVVNDQRLLVDSQGALGDEIVRDQLRKIPSSVVTFEESPLGFPHGWLRGARGAYHAEFTVALRVDAPVQVAAPASVAGPDLVPASARGGAGWLYLRLYDSAHRFDFLLRHALGQLVTYARERDVEWFFVRYNEPEPHLRLRFHVAPETEIGRGLTRLTRTLEQKGIVRRIGLERYEPEVERYGGPSALRACERIFCISSTLALDTLAAAVVPADRAAIAAGDLAALLFVLVPNEARSAVIESLRPPRDTPRLDAAQRGALQKLRAQWTSGAAKSVWRDLDLNATLEDLANASLPIADILSSLNHMHANRLGLHGLAERRLKALWWHFVWGRTREPSRS